MLNALLLAALMSGPTETAVTLPTDPAPLHGTMLIPEGDTRAVGVIVAGSGPTDRDGNSPMGVAGATYRRLAEGLAAQGIATVRYDKRGIAQSAAAGSDESLLRFDDLARDAAAWADQAAKVTGLPCAWLIGHSEGALLAQVAAVDREGVCGLILLSPVGEPAGVALRSQLADVPEPGLSEIDRILSELEAGRTTASPPAMAMLFRASVQPYLISYLAHDPAALIAAYPGPVLLGAGTNDFQVPLRQAEILAAAQPRAELATFEGANHVLKIAPTDRAGNAATYADPTLPLAPGVVEAISRFVLQPR